MSKKKSQNAAQEKTWTPNTYSPLDELIYNGTDEDLRVSCRKLSKKDAITRQKALKEVLQHLQRNTDLLNDFIPFFSALFSLITLDPSHTCRDDFGSLLLFIVQHDKKCLRSVIPDVIGAWWQLIHDPIKEVATKCSQALDVFIEGTAVSKRFQNFTPKIILHFEQFFSIQSKEAYLKLLPFQDGWEENYIRIMTSNVNALTDLINKVTSFDDNEGLSKNLEEFLQANFTEERITSFFISPLTVTPKPPPPPPKASKPPRDTNKAGNKANQNKAGNNKGGHKSKRHDRGSRRKANAKKETKAAKAAAILQVPIEIPPETTESPFVISSVTSKQWKRCLLDCLLTIWQHFPLDKFNLLPESIPEDDEEDDDDDDEEEGLEISTFLNLILEQFESNDQVFNTLVMKALFQFVRLYHDRFHEEDTLQVFLRLEKMAKTMVSLWLPIIASFPVELYSVYMEVQETVEEVSAVELVTEEKREDEETDQTTGENVEGEAEREEIALAPPATPSSIVLNMIVNTIEKNTIMEDLVSTLQIITFLLNKFPSNRDEFNINATNSQTLLKAFVRIFSKIMDIKLLQPKNRSYSRFDQEREDGFNQDLVKCLRAMNKTTTEVFPTQWREFIWQPICQHIETVLLSPSTKLPVRLELARWISHVVNGVFEGSDTNNEEKTAIDCWYDPFTTFTHQIYMSSSSTTLTSTSQFDDAYLPFQLFAELIKVKRWRQENLQFITDFLHIKYLPFIYSQSHQTSYTYLAHISAYLEVLASNISNNSEETNAASFYSSLFPYHVDVALKLKNLRVLNVLLKFYEEKIIPKIIITQQQFPIGLNSVQLKEIEVLASQIITSHLNSQTVDSTSSLVDEVSYLIILLNLTSHHPKLIDKDLLQKLFSAGIDATNDTGALFARVFQLSLLATLKTVPAGHGTESEAMMKITWKPLCVQLFFQTLTPLETTPGPTVKAGSAVQASSQERDELRQIRKLLKIVLVHDWEAVRQSLFPLLTASERQDCVKEINHIIHDERKFPLTTTSAAKDFGRALIAYLNTLHTVVDASRQRHNDCEACALKIEPSLLPKIFSTALWRDILTYLNTSSDIIRQQAKGLPETSSSSLTPRSPASRLMSWPTVKFYWDVITQTILPIVLQEGSAVGRGRGGAGLHHHHHYPCKDFLQRLLFQSSSFLYFFLFIARMEESILPLPKVAYLSQRFFTAVVDYYQQSASSPFASNLLLSMTVEWLKEVDSLLNLQRSTKMTSDLLKVIERMVVAIDPSSANPLSMSSLVLMNSDPQKGQEVWYLAKATDNAYSKSYNDEDEANNEEVLKLTWVRGRIMAIHNIEDPEDKFFVTVSYSDAAGNYREVQTHSIRLRVIDTSASTSLNSEEESEDVYYTTYFDERKAMKPPDSPPLDAHPTLRLLASLLTEVLNLLSLGAHGTDHVMLHLLHLRAHVIRWILQYYSSDIITSDPSSLFARLCSLLIDISKKPTRSPLHASFLAALLPCFLNLTALHPVGIIITENLFFHPAAILSNTSLIQSEEGDEMKEDVLAADVYHHLYYQLVTSISWRYSAKLIKKIFALDDRFTSLMKGGDDAGPSSASAMTTQNGSSSVRALLERLSIHVEKTHSSEEELAVADIRSLSSSVLRLIGTVWSSSLRNPLHPQQPPNIIDWEINLAQACIRSYYKSLARTVTTSALEEEEKKQREEILVYIIHQFLNYYYSNSTTHINPSNRLALFEEEVVSEKQFYSNLLQRFPSYQQPANSLLQHSAHRFLAMKLFSCLDLGSSALITQQPMSVEEGDSLSEKEEGKAARRRRAEEKFLSFLPEMLREEMRYQFSMISSASSISSVVHSSSMTSSSSSQSQQREEMTVIGTIVEYEIKENFLFTWLMFLSYLDLIPSFLASDVKSSFSQFCDCATEGDDASSSASWFLILITTLLKWTSIDSITGGVGGAGGSQKRSNNMNNKALTRKDLFSIVSLNFEELLGSGGAPYSGYVLPTIQTGDSSINDDTVVSWFSRQRLEDVVRASRLETISMDALVAHALYKTILTFPSMFRNYWTHHSPRAEKDLLLKFIHDHVRYAMISQEVQKIQDGGYGPVQAPETSEKDGEAGRVEEGEGGEEKVAADGGGGDGGERFEVIGNAAKGEITASIIHDESRIELVIDIPLEYPLKNVDITCKKLIGIAESKWLKWRLTMISLINSQDKSILEAILWWKSNLEKELDGLEPCIICYSVIHSKNSTLPSIACPTCKNKFHSSCLYTWFKTSGKNKCVLCQQPMMQ